MTSQCRHVKYTHYLCSCSYVFIGFQPFFFQTETARSVLYRFRLVQGSFLARPQRTLVSWFLFSHTLVVEHAVIGGTHAEYLTPTLCCSPRYPPDGERTGSSWTTFVGMKHRYWWFFSHTVHRTLYSIPCTTHVPSSTCCIRTRSHT